MENEIKDVDLNNDVDITEEEISSESEISKEQENKDEKPSESLEAKRARLARQLKQLDKKLGLDKNLEENKHVGEQPDKLGIGEKGFLIANGIKGEEEFNLVKKLQKETGKSIESLLDTTYFQQELNALRQDKASMDAIPSGSKRSNQSSVDSVEYWIAKNELPPVSEVELRRKVVNTMASKDSKKGMFYNS